MAVRKSWGFPFFVFYYIFITQFFRPLQSKQVILTMGKFSYQALILMMVMNFSLDAAFFSLSLSLSLYLSLFSLSFFSLSLSLSRSLALSLSLSLHYSNDGENFVPGSDLDDGDEFLFRCCFFRGSSEHSRLARPPFVRTE